MKQKYFSKKEELAKLSELAKMQIITPTEYLIKSLFILSER